MAKIVSIILLVGVIITVQALPPVAHEEIIAAAKQGQWDQVQTLLHSNLVNSGSWKPAETFDSVRELKPANGGHVYGEAEYSFHSASNVNGKTTEDHAGHKVVNEDGKVKEFDFTPKHDALVPPLIHSGQPQGDYSALDYSYHKAPAITESIEFNGGHKNHKAEPIPYTQNTEQQLPPQSYPGSGLNLNPGQGNHVFKEWSTQYSHSASFVNGKPVGPGGLPALIPPLSIAGVRDLRPQDGGQVYGEAQYSFHTSSNINGKVTEDQGGHKVINNNGQVQEFDFTPSVKPVNFY